MNPEQEFAFRACWQPGVPPPILARLRRAFGGWDGPAGADLRSIWTNWPGFPSPFRHIEGMESRRSASTFFTERTLAEYLSVSDRTVRNWIRRGDLPSYKLGAARRIDPADVEDFLARNRDEAA